MIYTAACTALSLGTDSFDSAKVSIYPNPSVDGTINIYSETVLDRIEIMNINGQLVRSIENPQSQNDSYSFTDLPSGFYFVKLISESQSLTKKVIVQ
jgi:hypothetical protein